VITKNDKGATATAVIHAHVLHLKFPHFRPKHWMILRTFIKYIYGSICMQITNANWNWNC